jgi:RNA polymerase-binding transcription factor DksA
MQSEYNQSLIELDELQSSSTDGAGDDQADAGSKTFEREQELSIAANRLDLLTQIKRAVERIDAGPMATVRAAARIPKARLKAFPMALDVASNARNDADFRPCVRLGESKSAVTSADPTLKPMGDGSRRGRAGAAVRHRRCRHLCARRRQQVDRGRHPGA